MVCIQVIIVAVYKSIHAKSYSYNPYIKYNGRSNKSITKT